MTLLRAEITKMRSRALHVASGALACLFGLLMLSASIQFGDSEAGARYHAQQTLAWKRCGPPRCTPEKRAVALASLEARRERTEIHVREARAAASSAAVPGLVLGLMGSGVGALVSLLAGVRIVALEFSNGMMGFTLQLAPRRNRLLMAKVCAAWLWVVATAGLAFVAVMTLMLLIRPQRDASAIGLPGLLEQSIAPLVVTVVFVCLGVTLAFLLRSATGAIGVAIAMLGLDFVLGGILTSADELAWPWSLNFNLWSVGENIWNTVASRSATYWVGPRYLGAPHPIALAAACLLGFAGSLVFLCAMRLRRDEAVVVR